MAKLKEGDQPRMANWKPANGGFNYPVKAKGGKPKATTGKAMVNEYGKKTKVK